MTTIISLGGAVTFGGYQIGQQYNRRRDLHGRFGGQTQGGISTPSKHPAIFLITGETGTQHGYTDGWTPDGVFNYFGEGQQGDMRWKGGNVAIRDHAANGKDLLLFKLSERDDLFDSVANFPALAGTPLKHRTIKSLSGKQ